MEVKNAKKQSIWKSIRSFILTFAVGAFVGLLMVNFVIADVQGSSMEPTLSDEDFLWVDKISLHFRDLQRGDIVVVSTKNLQHQNFSDYIVKRLIGLPGETIRITNGSVYINDVLVQEPYLVSGVQTYPELELLLNEDEYFCMGDNRGGSLDSRALGTFSKQYIEGRAVFRFAPFDKIGGLK